MPKTKHSVPTAPPVEKPHRRSDERLVVIAQSRVPRAVKAIQLVGSIGSYNPTPTQTHAMLTALRRALEETEQRLQNKGQEVFELPTSA